MFVDIAAVNEGSRIPKSVHVEIACSKGTRFTTQTEDTIRP